MKIHNFLLILFAASLVFCVAAVEECPVAGGSSNPKMQHLDSLKNRQAPQLHTSASLTVQNFLQPGNDATRWSEDSYITVTGYIVSVKYGGSETCNCHSTDRTTFDYHLEIADSPNPQHGHVMICEVSRYTQSATGYTLGQLKQLIGREVKITGYLFYDEEHHQNAFNNNPTGTDNWRQTCWEVHPVFSIEAI